MSDEPVEYIDIDGHRVDPRKADRFFNGDGTRVSDEQWDEDKRRAIAGLAGEVIVPLTITTEPPEGHVIASYEEED